jgi:hypothetical protein
LGVIDANSSNKDINSFLDKLNRLYCSDDVLLLLTILPLDFNFKLKGLYDSANSLGTEKYTV